MKPNVLRDFFKQELETLQAKTGIRQLENMMAKEATWESDLSTLLDLLVAECNRPAFKLIGVDVKMDIIRESIISDKDFIGLNAKFVYKSLVNWWYANGDRYLERHMQSLPKEDRPEPAPPEVREKYIQEWFQKLDKVGANFRGGPVLTPEQVKREGQEKPNMIQEQLDKLAPKADYRQQPDYVLKVKENIRRICAETYKHLDPCRMPKGFESFRIGEYDIYCESAEKAKEIYEKAKEF